jgi:DNA-binding protein H-NS
MEKGKCDGREQRVTELLDVMTRGINLTINIANMLSEELQERQISPEEAKRLETLGEDMTKLQKTISVVQNDLQRRTILVQAEKLKAEKPQRPKRKRIPTKADG